MSHLFRFHRLVNIQNVKRILANFVGASFVNESFRLSIIENLLISASIPCNAGHIGGRSLVFKCEASKLRFARPGQVEESTSDCGEFDDHHILFPIFASNGCMHISTTAEPTLEIRLPSAFCASLAAMTHGIGLLV
jgi:hypothetical protein